MPKPWPDLQWARALGLPFSPNCLPAVQSSLGGRAHTFCCCSVACALQLCTPPSSKTSGKCQTWPPHLCCLHATPSACLHLLCIRASDGLVQWGAPGAAAWLHIRAITGLCSEWEAPGAQALLHIRVITALHPHTSAISAHCTPNCSAPHPGNVRAWLCSTSRQCQALLHIQAMSGSAPLLSLHLFAHSKLGSALTISASSLPTSALTLCCKSLCSHWPPSFMLHSKLTSTHCLSLPIYIHSVTFSPALAACPFPPTLFSITVLQPHSHLAFLLHFNPLSIHLDISKLGQLAICFPANQCAGTGDELICHYPLPSDQDQHSAMRFK